ADRAGLAELRAQLRHVYVDRPGAGSRLVTPYRREQHVAGVDASRVTQEVGQQVKLGRRQLDRLSVDGNGSSLRVEDDRTDTDDASSGSGGLAAAQHGLEPRDQLARAERLGEVVVRTHLQAEDPLDLVVARGDEEDRRPVLVRPQPAADLGAVDAGQPD